MAICPFAQWKGPVPNQGGKMGKITLGVVHIMQGSLNGSDNWFKNPSAQVSAHFGIGRDGKIYQWVDTANIAWAEANYNSRAISVEHEGFAGDRLTDAQAWSLACLMKWCRQTHGLRMVRGGWVTGSLALLVADTRDAPVSRFLIRSLASLPFCMVASRLVLTQHPQLCRFSQRALRAWLSSPFSSTSASQQMACLVPVRKHP